MLVLVKLCCCLYYVVRVPACLLTCPSVILPTCLLLICGRTFLEAVSRVSQEGEDGSLLSLGPGDSMFYTFFVPSDRAFTRVNQVRGMGLTGKRGKRGETDVGWESKGRIV